MDQPILAGEDGMSQAQESLRAFVRRPGAPALLAGLLIPAEATIEAAGQGTVHLRLGCVDAQAAGLERVASMGELFVLDALEAGWLLVERHFAQSLVGELIGRPAPLTTAELTRVERGMLAGILALWAAKLGLPLGITVAAPAVPSTTSNPVCIRISARTSSQTGLLWLWGSPASLLRHAELTAGALTSSTVRMTLARTPVSRSEVLAASVGDVVVFDETPALDESAAWPIEVSFKGRHVLASLAIDGVVALFDDETATRRIRPGLPSSPGDRVEITARLAVGLVDDGARGRSVVLGMDNHDWASGTLCQVDGRMAVRISRMFAG